MKSLVTKQTTNMKILGIHLRESHKVEELNTRLFWHLHETLLSVEYDAVLTFYSSSDGRKEDGRLSILIFIRAARPPLCNGLIGIGPSLCAPMPYVLNPDVKH
mmetsp:Transcript_3078/g.7820  ORF Transcript_3078/g.7820 Transcript_3078/m.7820 type:complete len:103 (+) Transcript_3078:251-559(+)